jgi:hypothetical protein
MEFIEVDKGMRSVDLDKVEAIEKFGDMQTQLITGMRVHLINLPYAAVLEIVRKRAQATNSVRTMIANIDSNTQAVRS